MLTGGGGGVSNPAYCSRLQGMTNYLQIRVAPCNLHTGGVPWNPREHVRAQAVPHQAREEEKDKGELERDQK